MKTNQPRPIALIYSMALVNAKKPSTMLSNNIRPIPIHGCKKKHTPRYLGSGHDVGSAQRSNGKFRSWALTIGAGRTLQELTCLDAAIEQGDFFSKPCFTRRL